MPNVTVFDVEKEDRHGAKAPNKVRNQDRLRRDITALRQKQG
jgi:hypothetical protein